MNAVFHAASVVAFAVFLSARDLEQQLEPELYKKKLSGLQSEIHDLACGRVDGQ